MEQIDGRPLWPIPGWPVVVELVALVELLLYFNRAEIYINIYKYIYISIYISIYIYIHIYINSILTHS